MGLISFGCLHMTDSIHGILNINKPPQWTSHDVVAVARRILGQKQIGHLGTLDPLATGVLPLAVGLATRLVEYAGFEKEYVATCLLGRTTDTCDVTGKTLKEVPADGISMEQARAQVQSLREITAQVPPMVSAVKVQGRKLYEWARKDVIVERKSRPVKIMEAETLRIEMPRIVFRIACSAGTYIRVLCQTLGEALGVGGCLATLERTRVGPFRIQEAFTLEELKSRVEKDDLAQVLLSPALLARDFPEVRLEGESLEAFCHGLEVQNPTGLAGPVKIMNPQGFLCAIGEASGPSGVLKPRKVFGKEGIH
jgi:tRNA pseudouridine55 synthase